LLKTYETGRPGDEAILFLHAGGLSGKSWLPVMEELPDYHCLAPDLPEQGSSGAIPYSFEKCVSETVQVLRSRTPAQKAHVVALSLGGPVALSLAACHPEMVDHLLISGCSGHISRRMAALAKSSLWTYRLFKPETLVQATLRQHGIPQQYADLVHTDLLRSLDFGFMRRYMTELANWQPPEYIEQPLLMVVGEREVRAAFKFTKAYLRRYPSARGWVVTGASHAWSLKMPQRFAQLVRIWVSDGLHDGIIPKWLCRIH
jgi:pimeloyl-ACP methyl ester carboxylesterase